MHIYHLKMIHYMVMGANVMNGQDPECRRWIQKFREPAAAGEGGRERRQTRRRRSA